MAFPTTSVLDDFNRADAGTLGANWTAPIFSGESSMSVASNQCTASGGFRSNYWNVTTPDADCEVYCDWHANRTILYSRLANIGGGATDGYAFDYQTTPAFRIHRTDNDAFTQLGATETSVTLSAGDSFGGEASGSDMSIYTKPSAGSWSLLATRTDATYSAAGPIGAEIASGAIIDNFGGGTIVTASTVRMLASTGVGT